MRRLTWAALSAGLLLLTPTGSAQIIDPPGFGVPITASGTVCSTAGACALIPLSTAPSITIQIVGTFSATLQFEGTSDGQTWGSVQASKLSDGTVATSTTTTGQYTVSNVGLQQVRVRCSSYVSGTASVTGVRGYAMSGGRSSFFPSLTVTQGTLTADAQALSTSATWNNAGVTFKHWRAVITDTASAAGSLAVEILGGAAGTTNLFSVNKSGNVTLGGSLNFASATALTESAAGKLTLTGTTPMLQLGGTSSSFPAFKQSSASIQARLADDSGYAVVNVAGLGINTAGQGLFFVSLLAALTGPSSPASCGTSPAVTNNNGTASFVITGGTGGAATGCTITMPASSNGWNCSITNITQTAAHRADRTTVQTASTNTSVTWEYQTVSTGAATAFTASDVFKGICFGY